MNGPLTTPEASVIPVSEAVIEATRAQPEPGFPRAFLAADPIDPDRLHPGDLLRIAVHETIKDGLLGNASGAGNVLETVRIEEDGGIFIPYAGRIEASGKTPEILRRDITAALAEQTPDPQVTVSRIEGEGPTVSVMGDIRQQGVLPLTRSARRLSQILAQAGGSLKAPESTRITVMRDTARGSIRLDTLFSDTAQDIALKAGDRILVEADDRSFIVMGATGQQREIAFDHAEISALEALVQGGGLDTRRADPTGIFILRRESSTTAANLPGNAKNDGPVRVVYVLDLTGPRGMFLAREFQVRDGDTLYVTEAPFTQWQKVLGLLTGTAGAVTAIDNLN